MPKEYLKMHKTYIICPDVSAKKNLPVFMKKALTLSQKYGWPIVKSDILKDLATNSMNFPEDLSDYLMKVNNVRECINVGLTSLKRFR